MEITSAHEFATKILALVETIKGNLRWGMNLTDIRDAYIALTDKSEVELSLVHESNGCTAYFPVGGCKENYTPVQDLFPKRLQKTTITLNLFSDESTFTEDKADKIDELLKRSPCSLKVNFNIDMLAGALQGLPPFNFISVIPVELEKMKLPGLKGKTISLIETAYRGKKFSIDVLDFVKTFAYELYVEIQEAAESQQAA